MSLSHTSESKRIGGITLHIASAVLCSISCAILGFILGFISAAFLCGEEEDDDCLM